LNEYEQSALCSDRFTSGHLLNWSLFGPQTGLDVVATITAPQRESNSDHPARKHSLY